MDWIEPPYREGWSWRMPREDADRRVPDAFGLQLLGPGHLARFAESPRWTIIPLSGGRALVEHTDAEAWFAGPRPRPDVVRAARGDFAKLMRTN